MHQTVMRALHPREKKHGRKDLSINISKLLEEARSWEEDEKVNWTQLATKYGLTAANRGQDVKELLWYSSSL